MEGAAGEIPPARWDSAHRARTAHGSADDGRGRERLEMPRFVKMATLDELPPGAAKEIEYEGRVYAIFNVDGVVSAIDGICPHQGGPLADGSLSGTTVTCPWHGWQFDLQTGKTPLGSKIKQTVYDVTVEGRDILVAVP
jgi:nitrite reductase/ring-hydroxylating ferredoxin subunit